MPFGASMMPLPTVEATDVPRKAPTRFITAAMSSAALGVIALMDLRLLGLVGGSKSVAAMERDTVPVVWTAFALALVSGGLLFVSKAATYMANPYFLWKMGLMLLAGLNMAIFHVVWSKGMADWGRPGRQVPTAAKLSGLLSLALWMVIPLCGRIVGFTLGVYY